MPKTDWAAQNQLPASDVNDEAKEILDIRENLGELDERAHWEFLSSAAFTCNSVASSKDSTTANVVIPPGAKFAVVVFNGQFQNTNQIARAIGQLLLDKLNITTQQVIGFADIDSSGNQYQTFNATWSALTIDVNFSYKGTTGVSPSNNGTGTIYFYT